MSFLNKNGQVDGSPNNRTANSSWGGFLKQAITSVETSLEKAAQDKQKEQESLTKSKSTPTVAKSSLDQDRLAARLAAAVSSASVPKKPNKGRKGKNGVKKKPLVESTSNPLNQPSSSTSADIAKQDVLSLNSVSTRSSTEVAWDPLQSSDVISDTSSTLETEKALDLANETPNVNPTTETSIRDAQLSQEEILSVAVEVPLPQSETDDLVEKNTISEPVEKSTESQDEQTQDTDNNTEENISSQLNEPEDSGHVQETKIITGDNNEDSEVVEAEIDGNQDRASNEHPSQDVVNPTTKENTDSSGVSKDTKNDPVEPVDVTETQESETDKKTDNEQPPEEAEKAQPTSEPDQSILDKLKQSEKELAEKIAENTTLNATITILKGRLKSVQGDKQNDNNVSEKQIENVTKERDQAREKLTALQREMQQAIAQKDQRISELFSEGEKLSKQELKLTNMIKQLRAKGVDLEKAVVDIKRQFNDSQKEVTALKSRNVKYAESERKLNDACKSLRKLSDEQSLKINKLESQLQESKEAQIDLQVALERAWDDLNKSRKTLNESLSDLKRQSQENEDKIRAELQTQLRETQAKYEQTIESYKQEISELQNTITCLNDDAGENEDELRKEISTLQMRLQSSEQRFQNLNASYMNSTQPLLKQIETLEGRHGAAQKHWEKVEERLTKELSEAKKQFESSESKCKDFSERMNELTNSKQELEAQLRTFEKETAAAQEQLQTSKDEAAKARTRIQELSEKLESAQKAHEESIERIKRDYEEQLLQQKEELTQAPVVPVEDVDEQKRESDSDVLSPTRMSFDSLAFPLSPVIASSSNEVLRAQIKNLESQITSLQAQLQLTIKDRDEISNELVQMTLEHKETGKDTSQKTTGNDELEERYASVLHELTEKSELVEELKSDISDMKEMYRVQIAELVNKIEKLMRK